MIKRKYLVGLVLLVLISSENLVSKVLTNKEWFKSKKAYKTYCTADRWQSIGYRYKGDILTLAHADILSLISDKKAIRNNNDT